MHGEPVLRIKFIVFAHERVAVHLGEDARRMVYESASPRTMFCCGRSICRRKLPSVNTTSGCTASPSTARFMHSRVASKMLMASIVSLLSSHIL